MDKVEVLQDDVSKFKVRLEPLIDSTLELVNKLNSISGRVETNINIGKGILEKVKKATDDIVEFKDRIQRKMEPPLMETIGFFSGLVKGIMVFAEKIKDRPSKSYSSSSQANLLFDEKPDNETEFKDDFEDINKELNEVRRKLEEMKKV